MKIFVAPELDTFKDLALTAVSLPLTWAFRHGVLTVRHVSTVARPIAPIRSAVQGSV